MTVCDDDDTLPRLLEKKLNAEHGDGFVDFLTDDDGVSIAADEWTLRFENERIAWLAIDAEPDDPDLLRTTWRQVVGEPAEQLLSEINRETDDALAARLEASGDLLSIDMARVLRQRYRE